MTDNVILHPALKKQNARNKLNQQLENEKALIALPNDLDKLGDEIRLLSMDEMMQLREDTSLGSEIRQLMKTVNSVRRQLRGRVRSLYPDVPAR